MSHTKAELTQGPSYINIVQHQKRQRVSYACILAVKEATYVSEGELGSTPLPLLSDYMSPKPDYLY